MSIATHNPSQIENFISLTYQAYLNRYSKTLQTRLQSFLNLAKLLTHQQEELAKLITQEMHKPITQSRLEIQKCISLCEYYSIHGESILAPKLKESQTSSLNYEIHYHPLGVVLGIMPWNFPFWQVIRSAVPILLSGNSYLLKHASNVPLCAMKLEELFYQAGFENEFKTLLISSQKVQLVIIDPRVSAITLTGSEKAGSEVAKLAGQHLKKLVLELGGSDPFIVTLSAPLEKTVDSAIRARLINSGQSCIAAKRFIIHQGIYEEFKSELIKQLDQITIGNPFERSTELAQLATTSQSEELRKLIEQAKASRARVIYEKGSNDLEIFPITVIENISTSCKLYHEEAFGPVFSLYKYKTLEEAIQLANTTRYGLGASIWTTQQIEADLAIERIDAGSVFVNEIVSSHPERPFGGVKVSGYGREMGSEGVYEFCNKKTVVKSISSTSPFC